jgi:hypothetical protein
MALEATSLEATVRRVVEFVRANLGQVLLYLVMRVLLTIAGAFILELGLLLGMLIALIPLGGIGAILWAVLHQAGTAGYALMIAGWVILGLLFFALLIAAAIMTFGYLHTFLQAYALYFFGGHYPPVGQYLEPLLPQPIYAYPGVPPEYYPPAQPAAPPVPEHKPDPDSNT